MGHYWPFSSLTRHGGCRGRLIVSLDHLSRREALKLVDRLAGVVGMFKIGKPLFNGGGPELVREVRKRGGEVFLDLKFHDSAPAVARAAIEATRLGVRIFDLHPCGSVELMERVRAEVTRTCRSEGLRRPHILAVAMLAGLDAAARADGLGRVARAARLAADAGLDGALIRPDQSTQVRALCGRRFIIATSGFRPSADAIADDVDPGPAHCAADDAIDGRGRPRLRGISGMAQTCAPRDVAEAIRAGADYVVVGSLIRRAIDPVQAACEVAEEMERGLRAINRVPAPTRSHPELPPRPGRA